MSADEPEKKPDGEAVTENAPLQAVTAPSSSPTLIGTPAVAERPSAPTLVNAPATPVAPAAASSSSSIAAASAPESNELEVRLFARTDVGQIREHNEDNFLVADLTRRVRGLLDANRSTSLGSHGILMAVCDGMGGAAAGEVASQLAVDILFEKMIEKLEDGAKLTRDDLARRLVRAVEVAGQRIFNEAKNDRSRRGMGTTVTAAALLDNHLFLAQVGDSRGYILRGDKLVQVTRDQSLVNQLIEAGQLTEEEAETFEHNNIILQALGTSDSVQVDLTYVPLVRGDTLLLCSDGLSGMIRDPEIREIMKVGSEAHELCRVLIERANQAGGHDNITAIIARFEGGGLPTLGADSEEPLVYRKYSLPEEHTAPMRISTVPPADNSGPLPGLSFEDEPEAPEEPGDDPQQSRETLPAPSADVPPWLVVFLVLGVIGVLVIGARVLLH